MGNPTLNCLGYILVVFQTLQDSTSIAFKGYLFCIFVHLGTHHIVSNWFEILQTSPNHCLLSIKQSLSKLWCAAEGFLELTSGCNILPLSFLLLNFWKFANSCKITWNFAQMTETVFVDEKTYFEFPRIHLSGFADSPRFHLYSFQGYLFGIFLHLENQHITSNWFEILHTSPNHCLLSIKQSLSKLWCTAEGFLELASGCNILPLSFLLLNFWKFANSCKITWNFAQMTETVFVDEKTFFELPRIHLSGFADSPRFHLYSFHGYLFGIFLHLENQHITSNWFEILHTLPNHCLLSIKQSLSKLWCTVEGFLELTSGCNILPLSFLLLNFWKFANSCKITWNFAQMTETVFVDKKTYFQFPRIHLSGFADSPRFHLYSFQGYLFGIFLHLENQHITSNWFEILHTSPNHCLLSIKQSLSKLWCTVEGFLELTSGCNILPLSFLLLNFWKFANSCKITWNFAQMSETVFVDQKTYFELPRIHLSGFADSPRFHLYSLQRLSLLYLCSFGNSPYRIKLIWNFAYITESLPVVDKTQFEQVMMRYGGIPRVDQWL